MFVGGDLGQLRIVAADDGHDDPPVTKAVTMPSRAVVHGSVGRTSRRRVGRDGGGEQIGLGELALRVRPGRLRVATEGPE